jgi:hypothetical protein
MALTVANVSLPSSLETESKTFSNPESVTADFGGIRLFIRI